MAPVFYPKRGSSSPDVGLELKPGSHDLSQSQAPNNEATQVPQIVYLNGRSIVCELYFSYISSIFMFLLFLNVYLFILREKERARVRERQRQRIPSRPRAVSAEPDSGLELTNCEIATGAETKSRPLN